MDELNEMLAADIARIEQELQIEIHMQGHPGGVLCNRCERERAQLLCPHEDTVKLIANIASLYSKKFLCNDCGLML